jgi:hypothetical protein
METKVQTRDQKQTIARCGHQGTQSQDFYMRTSYYYMFAYFSFFFAFPHKDDT